VVATGLQAPHKILLTPGGNFLVSETSPAANSGRISFVSRSGVRRSLFEGMPSGIDPVGAASGPTALALRGETLYIAIGGGDAERRGQQPGVAIHNPEGVSSPIHASVLEVRFNVPVDSIGGTFVLTPEHQQTLADGYSVEVHDGADGRAQISLLTDIPNSVPDPNTVYRFSNPWGLVLAPGGGALYLIDASRNNLVRIDTATGRSRTVTAFRPLPNSAPIGPPLVDAVPTSIRIYGSQLLVSFLTGFPFSPGAARVLVVNPEQRTVEPFIFGLTSATDVLPRIRPDGRLQVFVLEFSGNQTAQPLAPGRLLRYDSPNGTVVTGALMAPVSMALDERENVLFILELTGRILRIAL
jgi:hypothetical protein